LTTSHEAMLPEESTKLAEVLRAEGCDFATFFIDGPEIVIDGCAPSYEAKQRLQELVRAVVTVPIRNSIRVYPN
jgi:hypothetical protein